MTFENEKTSKLQKIKNLSKLCKFIQDYFTAMTDLDNTTIYFEIVNL